MMYVGKRIANPHLETAGLQIRRNKYAYTWTADEPPLSSLPSGGSFIAIALLAACRPYKPFC